MVSGLPAGATGTFTPSTIAAGSGATTITLTVKVPQQTGMLVPSAKPDGGQGGGRGLAPIALGILLLPFAGRVRRSSKRLGRLCCLMALLLASAGAVAGLSGCGTSNGFNGQPRTTSTLTVTATSGNLSHSTNLTLIVQ